MSANLIDANKTNDNETKLQLEKEKNEENKNNVQCSLNGESSKAQKSKRRRRRGLSQYTTRDRLLSIRQDSLSFLPQVFKSLRLASSNVCTSSHGDNNDSENNPKKEYNIDQNCGRQEGKLFINNHFAAETESIPTLLENWNLVCNERCGTVRSDISTSVKLFETRL